MPGRLMSSRMASGGWRCSAPSAASALRTTTGVVPYLGEEVAEHLAEESSSSTTRTRMICRRV